jgi:GNAT superfamily N-acetyltransferase
MREGDLGSAERVSGTAFLEVDRSSRRVDEPQAEGRSAADSAQWTERMRHFLETDPDGCWVAVDEPDAGDGALGADGVVGVAVSQNRGGLWFLVTYAVLPDRQGQGIGTRLMEAVLDHAGDRKCMLVSSSHAGATRRYLRAGFTMQPVMWLTGTVDRSTLPAVTGLRSGDVDDIEWMDRLDEDVRGAGRGPDHLHMLERMGGTLRLIVSKDKDRPGYVYADDQGRATLLAARHPDTARELLWEVLASARGRVVVSTAITAANQWALDVGVAARLDLGQEGYLALRGMDAPAPYLPSGRFL